MVVRESQLPRQNAASILRLAQRTARFAINIWAGLLLALCTWLAIAWVGVLVLSSQPDFGGATLWVAAALVLPVGAPIIFWLVRSSLPRAMGALAFYPLMGLGFLAWGALEPVLVSLITTAGY